MVLFLFFYFFAIYYTDFYLFVLCSSLLIDFLSHFVRVHNRVLVSPGSACGSVTGSVTME